MRRESTRSTSRTAVRHIRREKGKSGSSSNRRTRIVWVGVLAFWMMFLTGVLNDVTGSPGALQALRLRHMLASKNGELTDLEQQILKLDSERHRLEDSSAHQEREIRRVLGYAAPGEIIFDFSRGLLQK